MGVRAVGPKGRFVEALVRRNSSVHCRKISALKSRCILPGLRKQLTVESDASGLRLREQKSGLGWEARPLTTASKF